MREARRRDKQGSTRPEYVGPLESGLNRRAFLRQSGMAALSIGLMSCKPILSKPHLGDTSTERQIDEFSEQHKAVIAVVQAHLFPDDGDGPSAHDINALAYLEWALTDPENIEDGDRKLIVQGIELLEDLSKQTQGDSFLKIPTAQQDKILRQVAKSNAGENSISILIYYLLEALLLDPIYGGNPEGIGWQWLNHQPGFPRPPKNRTYRHFG